MARAGGEALAWALDLWRQPGARHALRARPLPDGMEQLLAIAGGASAALAEASAATGEPPAQVQEQVRFALREQLLFPDADAYRTLGLAHGAPAQALRSHHRLLQLWLHPDRCDGEDAVFAARVNAAWDQLRTPERRQAYDARLPLLAGDPGPHAGAVVWRQGLLPEHELRAVRWRQRAPLIALLVACIGLGALVVREQAREPVLYAGAPERPAAPDPLDVLGLSLPSPRTEAAPPAPARAPAAPAPAPRENRMERLGGDPAPSTPAARVLPPAPPAPAMAQAGDVPAPSLAAKVPAPAPSPAATLAPPALAPRPPPAAAQAAAPPPPPPASSDAPVQPDPQRARAAQRTGDRLLGYLAGRGAWAPPIWDSRGVQQVAQAIRSALVDAPRAAMRPPEWRIGDQSASLVAAFQYQDGTPGRVRARLVWREQRWLVSDVAMERDQ